MTHAVDPMQEKFDKVIERATQDPTYRRRLKAEAIAVLKEAGIEIPDGVEVRVRDFDINVRYLFLPPLAASDRQDAQNSTNGG